MRKINSLAIAGASLLFGAAALTACSSSDDALTGGNDGTQNGDEQAQEVKTQFAISIPYANGNSSSNANSTRMTGAVTQQDGSSQNFRGMKNISLLTLELTSADDANAAGTETATSKITLEGIGNTELTNSSSKIYSNVAIPVGTNHFLFYGEGGAAGETDEQTYGTLSTNIATAGVYDLSDIKSNLVQISANAVSSYGEATALLGVINKVAGTTESNTAWSAFTSDEDIQEAYTNFVKLEAGSSNSICLALQNLYLTMSEYAETTSGKSDEAKAMASAIVANITGTEGSLTWDENNSCLKWKDEVGSGNYDFNTNLFPQSAGLPEGAAKVTFSDANKTFSYNTNAIGSTNNSVNVTSITYPASLWYFTDTPLMASNSIPTSWPNTIQAWNETTNWTAFSDNAVTNSTRAIALKNNIQYAVALLKTTIKVGNQVLNGNNSSTFTTTNNQMPLTAILVGGQPDQLNWQFMPTTADNTGTVGNSNFNQTIYDNKMNSTIYAGLQPSDPNYTLVLDTKGESTKTVYVALEFENESGSNFYGYNNQVIAPGQKFYLVGKLDASESTPNYASTISDVDRVFLQDHTTTANFTINDVKNAYVTIPDLRATNLQLGLSVDLEWQAGYTFNVTIEAQ